MAWRRVDESIVFAGGGVAPLSVVSNITMVAQRSKHIVSEVASGASTSCGHTLGRRQRRVSMLASSEQRKHSVQENTRAATTLRKARIRAPRHNGHNVAVN